MLKFDWSNRLIELKNKTEGVKGRKECMVYYKL